MDEIYSTTPLLLKKLWFELDYIDHFERVKFNSNEGSSVFFFVNVRVDFRLYNYAFFLFTFFCGTNDPNIV